MVYVVMVCVNFLLVVVFCVYVFDDVVVIKLLISVRASMLIFLGVFRFSSSCSYFSSHFLV